VATVQGLTAAARSVKKVSRAGTLVSAGATPATADRGAHARVERPVVHQELTSHSRDAALLRSAPNRIETPKSVVRWSSVELNSDILWLLPTKPRIDTLASIANLIAPDGLGAGGLGPEGA